MSGINKDDREAPFKRLMYANENNSKPKTKRRHAEASKQRPNKHQQNSFIHLSLELMSEYISPTPNPSLQKQPQLHKSVCTELSVCYQAENIWEYES